MSKSPFEARQSQAIPFNLRANREAREPDWVETPQGKVLVQVERRLHNIIAENGFAHYQDALDELDVIKARILAVHKEYQDELKARIAASAIRTEQALNQALDIPQIMSAAMAEYIKTGDITSIVPNGRFTSAEERSLWQRFTMIDVTKVNGRTVHALKTSNGKAYSFMVTAPGVQATIGKAAALDDGHMIIDILPLGKDADILSRTFNSLYRS